MNNQNNNIINLLTTTWEIIWSDPIGWFLELSLLFQILILIGLLVLVIAVLVLGYYILKGVAKLLSHVFKGLYSLFDGLYTWLSKLFKELFHSISGKPRKKDQKIPPISKESISQPEHVPHFENITEMKYYCTECGQKITESMNSLITERGVAFCFYCGKEFTLKKAKKSKT